MKYVNLFNKENYFFNGLYWLWVTFLILILDLISKNFILNNFKLYESLSLTNYFNLVYVKNYGGAFSFLANKGGWQSYFFVLFAIIICIVFIIMMYFQNINKKLSNIAYALLVGGAMGNLYDRLVYGFVIDFIDFHIKNWHWPIFNIADIAICIGSILIILNSFMNYK